MLYTGGLENTVLARAAAEYGIEAEYIDIWGHTHSTPDDVARAILASLGAGTSDEEIGRAIEQRQCNTWSRPLDATLVVQEDTGSIALRIPADRSGGSVKLEFGWEGGEIEHHWFWLPELPTLETASIRGREFMAKRVPLPGPLRLGYHTLRVYWMKEPELETFGESKFIVCPKRAHGIDRRLAGVAVSLYGLRSAGNWGCGDFTDLRAAIDALGAGGCRVHRAQSAACDSESRAVQYEPVFAGMLAVPELHLSRCRARG